MTGYIARGSKIGVAVSGGSDSVAVLHLVAEWAGLNDVSVHAATVDHGLRASSADEAKSVCDIARGLGVPHRTLGWSGWDGTGNLQDQAREARQLLLADWARTMGLEAVLLGHTQDDQAETFLMRLARGSGVDGLAAMAEARRAHGTLWMRPVLARTRDELKSWLVARGVDWVDDPSNEDLKFERVRFRKAADELAALGLDPARLAATATAMARAKTALLARALSSARKLAKVSSGVLVLDRDGLSELEEDTRFRLLAHALQWTSNQPYRPRYASLVRTWEQVQAGQASTLHGCQLIPRRAQLFIARELAAVAECHVSGEQVWDERWHVEPPEQHMTIAALGEAGLRALGEVSSDLPRAVLLSLPALWENETPIAVPALSWGLSVQVYSSPDMTSFLSGLIPH
ncbi:tRNA lysidine(34) synthetase TilS [Tropicimonas sp. S265A]|uniref:tRNA lysidine(34) synthetase TilS n=1 Tax=Tropicimonas sp. S265A TaxID=3415134 RepID=UPI003C79B1D3